MVYCSFTPTLSLLYPYFGTYSLADGRKLK